MISKQDLEDWQEVCQWLDKQSGKFATVLMLCYQYPDCHDLYQIYSPVRKELWLQHQIQLLKWHQQHPVHRTKITGWQLCPDWQISLAYLANNLPNNYDLVLGGQTKRNVPRIGDMVLSPKHQTLVLLGDQDDS